jgi:Family of unknown function (DUF5995)
VTYTSIGALLERMRRDLAVMEKRGDARRYFHATYLRTTVAVAAEIDAGRFTDNDWVRRWDLAFAGLYLDALDALDTGGNAPPGAGGVDQVPTSQTIEAVPAPWQVAFGAAREQSDAPPLRHVLFGINAHINFDLPQALLAVITVEEFDDPELLQRREDDHLHLDKVLASRVAAEDDELTALSQVRMLDRLLRPANRAATRRFLAESRAKVWRNALALDRARRNGPDSYAAALGELESLSAERVRDLAAPGQVLLKLARHGFGVLIPDA